LGKQILTKSVSTTAEVALHEAEPEIDHLLLTPLFIRSA